MRDTKRYQPQRQDGNRTITTNKQQQKNGMGKYLQLTKLHGKITKYLLESSQFHSTINLKKSIQGQTKMGLVQGSMALKNSIGSIQTKSQHQEGEGDTISQTNQETVCN